MKTRNGFVSNSSSSSFVVMTTKKDVDNALKAVNPKIRKKMREWFISGGDRVVYNGTKFIRKFGSFSSEETYGVMVSEPEDGGEDEELAFKEIDIFFRHLGPLSSFEGY